jgi:hypothetical protein
MPTPIWTKVSGWSLFGGTDNNPNNLSPRPSKKLVAFRNRHRPTGMCIHVRLDKGCTTDYATLFVSLYPVQRQNVYGYLFS